MKDYCVTIMSKSVGRFPASEVRAKCGEIYCMVFGNPNVGLERSLFWSLSLEFEPIGEENETSMTCEWIPWKFRCWKDLDGATLTAKYGDDGIEGSFYVCEHDLMETVTLSIRHVRENFFELKMEMTVDYRGSKFSDPEPHMLITGCAIVPFIGLYLDEGICFDDASKFVDLSVFECEPSKNEFGIPYYKPKLM